MSSSEILSKGCKDSIGDNNTIVYVRWDHIDGVKKYSIHNAPMLLSQFIKELEKNQKTGQVRNSWDIPSNPTIGGWINELTLAGHEILVSTSQEDIDN